MRLPKWLRKNPNAGIHVHELKKSLRRHGLHTVCEEARCPNQSECFARHTATFMIMGNVCTRSCSFCAVKNGATSPLDPDEPARLASQAAALQLKHVVVTSVTRDDLSDGGAAHFARTIKEIRKILSEATIEVLTPDFQGNAHAIQTVIEAQPHVFNHNLETVERLTPKVRSRAQYRRSLEVLKTARALDKRTLIKSGLMVGLGEKKEEVAQTIRDLKDAGCDIITIGQYLAPTKSALPVHEYIPPEQFEIYKVIGEEYGVKYMYCGPLVRSSYMAGELFTKRKGT